MKVTNCYQPVYLQKANNNQKSTHFQNVSTDSNYVSAPNYGYINFTGAKYIKTPFLLSTARTLKEVHADYKKMLSETSLEDIKQAVTGISKETGYEKASIIDAMQTLTQFANFRSLRTIGKDLLTHKFGVIGNDTHAVEFGIDKNIYHSLSEMNYSAINDDTGLNKMMNYFLNRKNIFNIEESGNKKIAYFIDERKLSQLEQLKEKKPEIFEALKNVPNLEFVMLSGFENGITIAARTKNLKNETINILNKAKKEGKSVKEVIDAPILERLKALDIEPHIIKNMPTEKTEEAVYKAMRPEQMSEEELFNIIDANSQVRITGGVNDDILVSKDIAANYLKNNLNVYSPERICKSLSDMHKEIVKYAKSLGKSEEDLLFIVPHKVKSYDYINYAYQKINNIPNEQFVKETKLTEKNVTKGKITVFLDDSTISGDSIKRDTIYILRNLPMKLQRNIDRALFACIYGTQKAEKVFAKSKSKHTDLICLDIGKEVPLNIKQYDLEKVLGQEGHEHGRYCCIFPYMAPDNNSELASNIALMHSVQFRTNPESIRGCGVKTGSEKSVDVAKMVNQIQNEGADDGLKFVEDTKGMNKERLRTGSRKDRFMYNLIRFIRY